jgi:hypothetical protein
MIYCFLAVLLLSSALRSDALSPLLMHVSPSASPTSPPTSPAFALVHPLDTPSRSSVPSLFPPLALQPLTVSMNSSST